MTWVPFTAMSAVKATVARSKRRLKEERAMTAKEPLGVC